MHTKKRILIISNYPIRRPQHGGQKRVAAIVQEYRKVFSDVKFVAIFIREHYPIYAQGDIYLTGEWARMAAQDHLTSDVQISKAMVESPKLRARVKNLLTSYRPDIIEIEQVFPFIGLQPILDELGMHPKIIHSSHNIETSMKADIMRIGNAPQERIDEAVRVIADAENYLAQHADLVVAVSPEDGAYYKKLGASNYTLASNGILPISNTSRAQTYWRTYFADRHVRRIATFVGSAHLPNMQGLEKMIGRRLGFLPLDTRLVLAGGVGSHLEHHFDESNILDQTFWRRAVSVGVLREEYLGGLITRSDVLLLPIIAGGGSNLKTAEAILSGKKVVATTFAFRGYETYSKLPNIYIADNPSAFREAITAALNTPLAPRTKEQDAQAIRVQWKYTLEDMVREVSKL